MTDDISTHFHEAETPAMGVDPYAVLAGGRRRRLRRVGAAGSVVAVLAVAAVVAVGALGMRNDVTLPATVPSRTASQVAPTTSPRPSCQTPSASALAAVDAKVRAAGEGNSLREGGVLFDPDSGMWLIAGPFQGPAGEGEGLLGIWATSTDPTIEPFTGKVYSVDDSAANFSTAPATDEVAYDPRGDVPVLDCW